jgi:hypothetical protein
MSDTAGASGCHPGSRNRDRDRIPDCWERRNGLVVGRRDQRTDKDRDGLTALQEYRLDIVRGGVFDPYKANVPNSDHDGGFEKFGWVQPTLDGFEDFDRDGYVNTAERVWRTNGARAGSHPSLPASGCIVTPWAVPHDGGKDATLLLQAVIDTVPDGRCLRLRAGGTYRADTPLKIFGRTDLTLDGNGAVIKRDRRGHVAPGEKSKRPHILITAGTGVTIENLTIDGASRTGEYWDIYETDHAFDVKGSTNLTIRDTTVRQVFGDFVYVDDSQWPIHSGINVPTTNLLVSGNTFRTAGRHGLGVAGLAVGVRFENNLVRHVGRSGIDFELHPGKSISQFEIVGNTFRDFRLNWIAAGEGAATDIFVGFNQILGDSMHIKIGPRYQPAYHERWTFEGNTSDFPHRSDKEVFFMHHVAGATFIGNVQPMYTGGAGRVFGLYGDVCGITLVDNVFENYQIMFDPAEPPPCS